MTVLEQVKDDLRGWRLGRVVTVVDRGFASDDNLAYLTRAGGHWIAGERLRDTSADVAQVLSRQGRYQSVRDNLRVKEVRLGQGDGARRFVLCHPEQAERDRPARPARLGRWLRQTPGGRLMIDRAKVRAEQRLDGKFLLSTNAPTCRPRTLRWATRTFWRPSAASATARPPWSCARSTATWNGASAPTCCCAGWRCSWAG
jgi:hypothetical protein